MSALGHEQTSRHVRVMSALPSKADMLIGAGTARACDGVTHDALGNIGARAAPTDSWRSGRLMPVCVHGTTAPIDNHVPEVWLSGDRNHANGRLRGLLRV